MNTTQTPTPSGHTLPLDFIDMIDDTGRALSLSIHGRKPDAQGWLRVLGGIPHQTGIKPYDDAARNKLMEWLCPGSVQSVNGREEMVEALKEAKRALYRVSDRYETLRLKGEAQELGPIIARIDAALNPKE